MKMMKKVEINDEKDERDATRMRGTTSMLVEKEQ